MGHPEPGRFRKDALPKPFCHLPGREAPGNLKNPMDRKAPRPGPLGVKGAPSRSKGIKG